VTLFRQRHKLADADLPGLADCTTALRSTMALPSIPPYA
jgi:hypothetical protein